VRARMVSRGVIKPAQVITLYKSQTFPTTGFGVVYNLKPELQKKIEEAFFSFKWDGTSLEREFKRSGEHQFIHMTYKKFWDVIRKIDAFNKVSYACK
jgi:phosphonate transport system substrate-binding protein